MSGKLGKEKVEKAGETFDLIVVGGGPAGLTAGIHASRLGLKTAVFEAGELGGRATEASMYENFPGFPEGITGRKLIERMEKQIARFGAVVKSSEPVIALDLHGELKIVTTRKATYHSSAIILATGTQRRKLGVPGEDEFLGRGVSYCRACDGPFFKGLKVAVVGSGKEALDDALFLADLATEVLLITHKETEAAEALKRRLLEKPNVKIFNGRAVAIVGEGIVKAIRIADFESKREVEVRVDGVFISLGWVPTTKLVKKAGIDVDARGCIRADRWQKTNIAGVTAAGDCTCGGMQVVTATGEGAMAAITALKYVREKVRARLR